MLTDSIFQQPQEISLDNDLLPDVQELAEKQGVDINVLVNSWLRDQLDAIAEIEQRQTWGRT